MSKNRLVACPSCTRHVRVSEQQCPFCEVALPPEFGAAGAVRAPSARLSRAAMYAVGVGTLSLAAACSSSDTSGPQPGDNGYQADAAAADDAGKHDDDAGRVQPVYGAPPADLDASDEDAPPLLDAAYGGPPPDLDASSDGGEFDASGPAPVYGAPPTE